jgi:hypothetical protein
MRDTSFFTIMSLISISVPGLANVIQAAFINFIYMDLLLTDKWLSPLIFPDNQIESTNEDLKLEESPLNFFFFMNGFQTRTLI